jgi:hypothetical protein
VVGAIVLSALALSAVTIGRIVSGNERAFSVLTVAGAIGSLLAGLALRHWEVSLSGRLDLNDSHSHAGLMWLVFAVLALVWLFGLAGGWLLGQRRRSDGQQGPTAS